MIIVVLLLSVIGISFFVRSLLLGSHGIQRRWEGGIRTVVALIVGLCACTIMFGMILILDLLERNNFSWEAFIIILRLSMGLFVAGYVLSAISLLIGSR